MMRALTWFLPIAAVAYLAYLLADSDLPRLLGHLQAGSLTIAAVTAVLYGAALYLLAVAWAATLRQLAPGPVDLVAAVRAYTLSIFAKYLPGNVFHYAGRQIAVARMGHGQKPPAQATVVEISGHFVAAGCLLVLLLPFASGDLGWLGPLLGHWPFALLAIAALGAAATLLLRRRGVRLWPALPPRLLGCLLLVQLGFFGLAALLGAWLAANMLGLPAASMPAIAFAYLLAWLVGFITPGAPGGLGVREACLVAALQGYGDLPAILAFAALSRAALLGGEALFTLSGLLLTPKAPRAATT
jgi:glycosyltransferase 2 family protein